VVDSPLFSLSPVAGVCKRSSSTIRYDNHIHITQPSAKIYVPNCDVSFANGELHQAYGYVTLTMSAWPKYGHRSLEGYRLPHLCSYSWPPCVYGLTPWVVLFSDDLLCLRSWHRTNQWHDSLLPRDPLWLTCFCSVNKLSQPVAQLFPCDHANWPVSSTSSISVFNSNHSSKRTVFELYRRGCRMRKRERPMVSSFD